MDIVFSSTTSAPLPKIEFAPKPQTSSATLNSSSAAPDVVSQAVNLSQDLGVSVTSDEERMRLLTNAAQQFAKFSYPVSDTRFTIFRDQSGQFVTRFTNLQTGKISYYPEQDMLAFARELKTRAQGTLVDSKV
ncbi:MAG: hypothetical protein J0L97_04290 [Alphaproteobacteria bacterium]|nr:hypothetical protein [Alphaproteobacteria bacterium]